MAAWFVPIKTGKGPLCLYLLGTLIVALGTGCRIVQTAANVPGQAVHAVTPGNGKKPAANPAEVEQKLMRFTDEYVVSMVYNMGQLRRGTNTVEPAELLKWKILLGTETCSIASGPNAIANMLDMTIFVTVTRRGLEEYWQPKVFGDSALPILDTCRNAETNIWRLAGQMLTPDQLTELRKGIDVWLQQKPVPENVLAQLRSHYAVKVARSVEFRG